MEEENDILGLTLPSDVAPWPAEGEDRFEAAFAAAAEERAGLQHTPGTADHSSDDDGDAPTANTTHPAEGLPTDLSDEQLLLLDDKSEAKQLGKHLYKRWKKLQKKLDKKRGRTKDKKSKSSKKQESSSRSKKAPAAKRERAPRIAKNKTSTDVDEEAFMAMLEAQQHMMGEAGDDADAIAAAANAERVRLAQNRQRQMLQDSAKKGNKRGPTAAQLKALATAVTDAMQKARAADEVELSVNRPPLHRIAIREKVQSYCQRQLLFGPLVEAGVLQELSYWLYDFEHGEPAPYELRTTALDLLLRFPIEEEEDTNNGAEGKQRSIDINKFTGLSREDLARTDVGRAVNSLRLHQQETPENRSKCVKLLQRLKRSFSGGGRGSRLSSSGARTVAWRCQRDTTVGTPFEVVMTASQSFQRAFMQPDPKDPTSYHNLLPWRPPVSVITNLSNNLADRLQNAKQ